MRMAKVYWIRSPEHTDINTEGYVGVTTRTIYQRLEEHKFNAPNKKLTNALKKYTDVVIELVYEDTEENCYIKENELRPQINIGWNVAIGGEVCNVTGRTKTEEEINAWRNTMLEIYGTLNTNTPERIEKAKQTREINGTKFNAVSYDAKEKSKNTRNKKYGSFHSIEKELKTKKTHEINGTKPGPKKGSKQNITEEQKKQRIETWRKNMMEKWGTLNAKEIKIRKQQLNGYINH